MAGDRSEHGLDVFGMHAGMAVQQGEAARCHHQILCTAWRQPQFEQCGLAGVTHQRLHIVEQGIGQVRVVRPDDASVSIEANVGAGAITLFGDEEGGFDHTRTFESTVAGEPTLHLDLDMGAGHIEITEN